MDLNSTKIFVSVISKGSFSKAAESLKTPVATVSRRVRELEGQVGFTLIERSTRKLRLTEAGKTLYEFASRGLEEMDAGLLALSDQQSELRGTLRLSLPPNFKPFWNLISDFQNQYEKIKIDIMATERRVDFIEDGIDLSVRIGAIDNMSAVARPLHKYRHKLITSKKYFKNNPPIRNPSDLLLHKCAMWGNKVSKRSWRFENESISFEPHLIVNDYAFVQHLVETGSYIAEVPPFFCENDLKDDIYIEVLDDFKFPEQEINLVYPSSRNVSRITRVFIDYCIKNFPNYFNS